MCVNVYKVNVKYLVRFCSHTDFLNLYLACHPGILLTYMLNMFIGFFIRCGEKSVLLAHGKYTSYKERRKKKELKRVVDYK